MNIKKFLVGASAGALLLAATASPAFADSMALNFETYAPGSINGQDGWSATGPYDQAVVLSTYGYPTFGTKSFRISNAITSGSFGDWVFSKSLINEVGEAISTNNGFSGGVRQPHFEAQFDIASTVPNAEQPGLQVSVSPDRGDGSRMSFLRFNDTPGGINITFADVQGTTNPANFVLTTVATGLNRSLPHTVKLTMDVLDGPSNDVVKVYIDGTLVHTGTSWENYYRFDSEASAEQSPRTTDSLIFQARSGGGTAPATLGNGFVFDNLSLLSGPILVGPPTDKNQCKKDGWKTFNNPSFKNQGQCVSYVERHQKDDDEHENENENENDNNEGHGREDVAKATGDIYMGSPSQQMNFSAFDYGSSSKDKGTVEYWNYDYPGPLHYTANVMCAKVSEKDARFMFQIPAGWPGLTGLYVVSAVHDGGTPGTSGDTYGHNATGNLATALTWCESGTGFAPNAYPITGGNLVVHD